MEQKQLPESISCGRTSLDVLEPKLEMGHFFFLRNAICSGCGLAAHGTGEDEAPEHCKQFKFNLACPAGATGSFGEHEHITHVMVDNTHQ